MGIVRAYLKYNKMSSTFEVVKMQKCYDTGVGSHIKRERDRERDQLNWKASAFFIIQTYDRSQNILCVPLFLPF